MDPEWAGIGVSNVAWSPDGSKIAFAGVNGPLEVVDADGTDRITVADVCKVWPPDPISWSPDGKYIAAIATEGPGKLMLFDVATQKWTEAVGSQIGYPTWSQDGKYIYFQDSQNQDQRERIVRLRLSDRKIEKIVDVKDIGRLTTGTFVDWFGLAPDDSPLLARDISTQEIYALDMQWP